MNFADWQRAKMEQHRQQLSAQGVNDGHAIINRMMGYVPDLHKLWVGTSDDQLIALSNEFPGFYRYALIMEEASEAERNKASRPYDGMAQCSAPKPQRYAQSLRPAIPIRPTPSRCSLTQSASRVNHSTRIAPCDTSAYSPKPTTLSPET